MLSEKTLLRTCQRVSNLSVSGAGLPVVTMPRKRSTARRCNGGGAADDESDLDVMLVERLSALEDFLTRQGLDV